MRESQPLLIWMAWTGSPCRGQDRYIKVEGWRTIWICAECGCESAAIALYSSCITSLSWLVLFYFYVGHLLLWSEDQTKVDTTVVFLLFSQHITYMFVFCPQGVVYLNGPTRVHDGGVRLCIWTSSFNSMCSVGEKGCGYVWVYFFSVNIPFLYSWWNVHLHQARYWPRCSFQILYF